MQKTVRLFSLLLVSSFFLFVRFRPVQPNGRVGPVNGHPILRADLDKVYNAQLANNPQPQTPSTDQADALRLNILKELIVEEIIEQRAVKLGLTATDAEVDAKLTEVKAPYTEE